MKRYPRFYRSQQGYILYMALVLLLGITILGLATMRSTSTEETMARGYRDVNSALQNAETRVQEAELNIDANDPALASCNPVDPKSWASGKTQHTTQSYRIDPCDGSSSLGMGKSTSTLVDQKYRVLSTDFDHPTRRGTQVVLETVYIP